MSTHEHAPRALTEEEMRRAFIEKIRVLVEYWAGLPDLDQDGPRTIHDRLSGLAHSILATLQGSAADLPAFDIVPSPHPEDEAFHKSHGEDWWVAVDINDGSLAGHLFQMPPRWTGTPIGAPPRSRRPR